MSEPIDTEELHRFHTERLSGRSWCALCHEDWPCFTKRAADEIDRLRLALTAALSASPAEPEPRGWPPLMRAEDVNKAYQEGGAWVVAVGRLQESGFDWLALNEVCDSRENQPFLEEWPNLLVVASLVGRGLAHLPVPPNTPISDERLIEVRSGLAASPAEPVERDAAMQRLGAMVDAWDLFYEECFPDDPFTRGRVHAEVDRLAAPDPDTTP